MDIARVAPGAQVVLLVNLGVAGCTRVFPNIRAVRSWGPCRCFVSVSEWVLGARTAFSTGALRVVLCVVQG